MKSTNPLIAFLKETILRFSTKSPKFFKVWQIISGSFVLIVGLPEALTIMNIHLPQLFNDTLQKVVAGASTGMFIISMLTTQSKVVQVTSSGIPLKKTDEEKLPFTALEEKKITENKFEDVKK